MRRALTLAGAVLAAFLLSACLPQNTTATIGQPYNVKLGPSPNRGAAPEVVTLSYPLNQVSNFPAPGYAATMTVDLVKLKKVGADPAGNFWAGWSLPSNTCAQAKNSSTGKFVATRANLHVEWKKGVRGQAFNAPVKIVKGPRTTDGVTCNLVFFDPNQA